MILRPYDEGAFHGTQSGRDHFKLIAWGFGGNTNEVNLGFCPELVYDP